MYVCVVCIKCMEPLYFESLVETEVVRRFPTSAKVYCQLGGGNRAPLHLCKRMLCVCVCVCEREREREIREREKEREIYICMGFLNSTELEFKS